VNVALATRSYGLPEQLGFSKLQFAGSHNFDSVIDEAGPDMKAMTKTKTTGR
jgi:hypothetical protein